MFKSCYHYFIYFLFVGLPGFEPGSYRYQRHILTYYTISRYFVAKVGFEPTFSRPDYEYPHYQCVSLHRYFVLMVGFEPTFSTYRYEYPRYKLGSVHQHFGTPSRHRTPPARFWRPARHLACKTYF